MIRRSAWLLLVCAALASGPGCGKSQRLTVTYFGDFHSQFEPRETEAGERGGFARLAAVVASVRAENPEALLLVAGDHVQGTPFFNVFHGEPEMRSLDLLGVDAFALGNHEFDNGTEALRAMLEPVSVPVVSANVRVHGEPMVPAWTSLRAGGARVAVIGATTSELPTIVAMSLNPGLTALPESTEIAQAVAEVRSSHDLVVLLTHCGFAVDSLLAATIPGIDLIVGGHDHITLHEPRFVPNGERGALIVHAGSRGEFLGRLDVTWQRGSGITEWTGRLLPVDASVAPDSVAAAFVAGYREQLSIDFSEVIAQAPQGCSAEGRSLGQTPLGWFVAESIRRAAGAEIGLQNSGGVRASIPPGPVTLEQVFRVLPFENTVVRCTLTGREVAELAAFIESRRGGRGFAQLAGLELGDGGPWIQGEPLDPEKSYRVATNSFVYDGGDGYTHFRDATSGENLGIHLRTAFIALARETGNLPSALVSSR